MQYQFMHILHASEWLKCTWLYIRYRTSVCMHSEMHHLVHTCMFRVQSVMHGHTRNNLAASTHNIHATAPRSCSYNYIFKVLFTAPSWYVFSIGFGHMSIFRWNLAPIRIPIQRNITRAVYAVNFVCRSHTGLSPSVARCCKQFTPVPEMTIHAYATIQCANHCFQLWFNPRSFAMTEGIQRCAPSSAYQYA